MQRDNMFEKAAFLMSAHIMPRDSDSIRSWWWLYAAAALSFVTTLWLPYIGEEAVYTITSLEMRVSHDFFVTTLYATNYGRPPLLNWLIIPLADVLGWDHVLLASRLVAAISTTATGLVLAWLTLSLTRNRGLAAFSALVFLSGDVLFYRGWLAYSEPLFTLCVFGAIACLWVAASRRQPVLLWLAVLALTCGVLAKVQTAYIFYGVAFAVLCADRDQRRVLSGLDSILAHGTAIAALLVWNSHFAQGTQGGSTLTDITLKLQNVDLGTYLKQFAWFPVETVLRFLPASAVAIYAWRRTAASPLVKADAPSEEFPWRTLAAILAINFLPYWLGPNSHIRYIMPLYPLASLLIAAIIWRYGQYWRLVATRWLAGAILLRFVLGLWLFPWYEAHYRGNYAATAAEIEAVTRGFPLYATDVSATGLSVTAHLDTLRFPDEYLRWPPKQWTNGFVLSYGANAELGQTKATYPLGGNTLYLLCRGAACSASDDGRK